MSFLKPKQAKSSSTSTNVNNSLLTSTYSPVMQSGVTGTNYLTSLLTGTGNTAAANAGYNNYLQMAGYEPAMRELSRNITGQGAAAGILNSGSTAKALQSRGAELNQSFYNNYLQQLAGLSGLGLQAGGIVANAGQQSNSTSTGGGPSTLGSIASAVGGIASIFSDRELKDDVEHVRTDDDGLEWVSFRYKGGNRRWLGVMADQVRKLRPWAMGPKVAGFDTVNYGAL